VNPKSQKQPGLHDYCRSQLASIISQGLKPIPSFVFDLDVVLNAPPVDVKRIENVLRSEANFAQRVLRLSNGFLICSNQSAQTAHEAVVLMGPSLFLAAVLVCAVTEFDAPVYRDQNAESLWAHSVHIGTLSEEIALHTEYPFPGMAFLAGLLHDIGYLPLLKVVREQEEAVDTLAKIPWRDNLNLERDIFGLDHCQIGHWMAKSWEFSPSLADAVLHHHDPGNAETDRHLAEIVHAAKYHCSASSLQ
jgi:HD-like signal output (HDOD) protein